MLFSIVKKRPLWLTDAAGMVVCVAASLGVYFFVLAPLMAQRSALESCRGELAIQSEKSAKLKASMSRLRNHLGAIQKELGRSQIKLEKASHINRRVAQINAFLADCELHVDQVQISPSHEQRNRITTDSSLNGRGCATRQRCDLIPISISGKGGYKQCVAFLHKLYQAFPDISVAGFELRGNPASPEQLGTFRFELFWLAQELKTQNSKLKTLERRS